MGRVLFNGICLAVAFWYFVGGVSDFYTTRTAQNLRWMLYLGLSVLVVFVMFVLTLIKHYLM